MYWQGMSGGLIWYVSGIQLGEKLVSGVCQVLKGLCCPCRQCIIDLLHGWRWGFLLGPPPPHTSNRRCERYSRTWPRALDQKMVVLKRWSCSRSDGTPLLSSDYAGEHRIIMRGETLAAIADCGECNWKLSMKIQRNIFFCLPRGSEAQESNEQQ